MLDPLKITTISNLDKKINEISRESGWNCQVSLFCMDDINPTTATVTIAAIMKPIAIFGSTGGYVPCQ